MTSILKNFWNYICEGKKQYIIETDREKAIKLAISIAKKGDIVITTGKSHEKSLARGKKEYPWDEYKAITKALSLID